MERFADGDVLMLMARLLVSSPELVAISHPIYIFGRDAVRWDEMCRSVKEA